MATAAELAGATSTDVAAARAVLATFIQERWPDLSISAGKLSDLVLGPGADALAASDVRATAVEASVDPETALATGGYDEDVLAAVLAGRGVTRRVATTATGTAALKFSTDTTRSIGVGVRLQAADGTYFKVAAAVRLRATTETVGPTGESALVADPAGGYVGTVSITAEAEGAAGNKTAGTGLTQVGTTLTGLTAAFAASDISGGADAETDAALLARLPAATAARTAGSALGATAILQDAVTAVSAAESIGFGAEGMMRGRSALTGQSPGRADLRFRTASAPARRRIRVTATLTGTGPGTWRFVLGRDAAPGLFRVEKVLQTANSVTAVGYTATTTFGFDVASYTSPPDIKTVADAAHSRFVTATVDFTDTDTSTSGMTVGVTTRAYDAVVRVVEGADDGQDAVDAEGARAFGGDCLVRAAVPVMTTVTAQATVLSGVTLPADEVAAAVASAINAQGISSTLSGAAVAAVAAASLPSGTALTLSSWSGTVYPADNASNPTVSGTSGLSVTTSRSRNLGPDTVAFYADDDGVSATVG